MTIFCTDPNNDWSTPMALFTEIDAEFGPFELDPCATHENAKCARYFTEAEDGLSQSWAPARRVWLNPPYGRGLLNEWMRKAYLESRQGALVVCLVPSRTDTNWWHEYALKGRIRFIRGRLRFGGGKSSAPFPCSIVILGQAGPAEAKA